MSDEHFYKRTSNTEVESNLTYNKTFVNNE